MLIFIKNHCPAFLCDVFFTFMKSFLSKLPSFFIHLSSNVCLWISAFHSRHVWISFSWKLQEESQFSVSFASFIVALNMLRRMKKNWKKNMKMKTENKSKGSKMKRDKRKDDQIKPLSAFPSLGWLAQEKRCWKKISMLR